MEVRSAVIFFLLVASSFVLGEDKTRTRVMMYLSQFGYLPPGVMNSSTSILSQDVMTDAVKEFQAFAGLEVTGEIDDETQRIMSLPRCGVQDKVRTDYGSMRFQIVGSRWRVKDLTYRISKYPRYLSKMETDIQVKKAFSVWSDVTPLTFTKKSSGAVHIEIKFERGGHGDRDPFDGPGGTLAHAFFPENGDAHFDDTEKWTVNSYRGINLFKVAAHEFGHSLGLGHSKIQSALMTPFYNGYQPDFVLDDDDIDAIQTLYGKGNKATPPALEPPEEEGDEDNAELCNDATVDTMLNSADGNIYVFKGQHYWKVDGMTNEYTSDYPKLISKSWIGLPGNIDAAFTYTNGKTYFFKGSQYWRYNGKKMDGNFPKLIRNDFRGIPDNIDAVMVWPGNGKIYFFKGSKFWNFHRFQRQCLGYSINDYWHGIPDNLDGILTHSDGWTYFFKQGQYYRFNGRSMSVADAFPAYPRNTGHWWFGCRSKSEEEIAEEPRTDICYWYTDESGMLLCI